MKPLLTAAMIAAMALPSGIPAQAQTSNRRIVYCQPKPFCPYGQTSVCQLWGDADDACYCKRWSRCFGQLRTPPTQPRSGQRQPSRPGALTPR